LHYFGWFYFSAHNNFSSWNRDTVGALWDGMEIEIEEKKVVL
jgi:hypothetical protein